MTEYERRETPHDLSTAGFFAWRCPISRMIRTTITGLSEQVTKMTALLCVRVHDSLENDY